MEDLNMGKHMVFPYKEEGNLLSPTFGKNVFSSTLPFIPTCFFLYCSPFVLEKSFLSKVRSLSTPSTSPSHQHIVSGTEGAK